MSRAWSWGMSPAANAFDVASSAASRSAALTSWRAARLEDCNSSRTARSAATASCWRAISATAWDFIAANFDSARPIKLIRARNRSSDWPATSTVPTQTAAPQPLSSPSRASVHSAWSGANLMVVSIPTASDNNPLNIVLKQKKS